jgi:carboxypeptidase Q
MAHMLVSFALAGALIVAGCSARAGESETLDAWIAADANRLAATGMTDAVGLSFVEGLTTDIGPRLAGSAAEAKARDWATAELKKLGFQNVRTEAFTLPYWARVSERAYIIGDVPQDLVMTALGGSPATPKGGIEAEVVRFESLDGVKAAAQGTLTGKIVFIDERMQRTQDGAGYGLAGAKRRGCAAAAAEKGAAACLIRSVGTQPHRMAHTGIMGRDGPVGALPSAALSGPDADQLTRRLAKGAVKVHLEIDVITAETANSGNVIAEVTGSDRKDEIILLGCHLDSWDKGTGALDDGAGCGIVVGAARLIDQMPGKPRRTIRVVLYGSEEVGLFGGAAYAKAHGDELARHVLASESDFGAGPIWRLQSGVGEGALPYIAEMHKALAPYRVAPGDNTADGGPDIGVLSAAGVPTLTPNQDGTDYFDYHHTPDDTFDKIDPETFRQNVAVYAAFTWMASETGWDFRKGAAAPAAVP